MIGFFVEGDFGVVGKIFENGFFDGGQDVRFPLVSTKDQTDLARWYRLHEFANKGVLIFFGKRPDEKIRNQRVTMIFLHHVR